MQRRHWVFICLGLAGVTLIGAGVFFMRSDQWGSDRIEIIKDNYVEPDKSIYLLNLNDAEREELILLPGVGEKTADKIIQGRPYQNISEMLDRKIVTQKVFEEIKDKVGI